MFRNANLVLWFYKGVNSPKKTNVRLIAVVKAGKRMSRKGQGTPYIARGGMIEEERPLKVSWKPRGMSISLQVSLVHLAYSSRALVAWPSTLLPSVT